MEQGLVSDEPALGLVKPSVARVKKLKVAFCTLLFLAVESRCAGVSGGQAGQFRRSESRVG